jgi:hypothetical protein
MFMIGAAKAFGKRCRTDSLEGHIDKIISKERKRFQKLFRNKEDKGENVIIIVPPDSLAVSDSLTNPLDVTVLSLTQPHKDGISSTTRQIGDAPHLETKNLILWPFP